MNNKPLNCGLPTRKWRFSAKNVLRNIVAISIILLLLSYESNIWYTFNQGHFFANSIKLTLIILISACFVLFIIKKRKRDQYYDNSLYKAILTFALLFIYIFIPTMLNGDLSTSIILYIKNITLLIIFIIMSFLAKELDITDKLKKIIVALGLVFSLQQVVLFGLMYTGVDLDFELVQGKTEDALIKSYGLLGFNNFQLNMDHGSIIRSQSYFSESTRFGIFLIYPLMYFIAQNTEKPSLCAMLMQLIVFLGIFVAGSTSVLFAVILTLIGYFGFLRIGLKGGLAIFSFVLLALSLALIYYMEFLNVSQKIPINQVGVFSGFHKGYGSFNIRIDYILSVHEYVINNPLGAGLNFEYSNQIIGESGKLPLGLVGWYRDGGIIGLVLFSIALLFFLRPVSSLLYTGRSAGHDGPLALIAFFIASSLNGTLFMPTLFLIFMIIAREARVLSISHRSYNKT